MVLRPIKESPLKDKVFKDYNVLITGVAGFIGSEIVKRLLSQDIQVFGIDNLNCYYNPLLKQKRINNIEELNQNNLWSFYKENLENAKNIDERTMVATIVTA